MDMQNKHKMVIAILLGIALLIGIQQMQPQQSSVVLEQINLSENAEDSISQPESVSNEIVVHVAGAVENPGVYTLLEGQRVEDAIQKAGIAVDADADALNRAAVLSDGQKILVPFIDDSHTINPQNETDYEDNTTNNKINLNQATMLQLMDLPNIGEVKAKAIIQYRQEHGRFQSIDELLLVNGIGNTIYAQLVDLVCV